MSKLRNVDDFQQLWERRTTLQLEADLQINLISVADLVKAKKTARDKDWPMIKRLIDLEYLNHTELADEQKHIFFLTELRSIEFLIECALKNKKLAERISTKRPLLIHALNQEHAKLESALRAEEAKEREEDIKYWASLKEELEKLRHSKTKK